MLVGGAAARGRSRRARSNRKPVVGHINAPSADAGDPSSAFRRGLQEAGYVDGHNVAIEYRWAEHQIDRLPAMAADLVHVGWP